MKIKVTSYDNFLVYLNNISCDSILVCSLCNNKGTIFSFDLPTEKNIIQCHFVLSYKGISISYIFTGAKDLTFTKVETIIEVAKSKSIEIIDLQKLDQIID